MRILTCSPSVLPGLPVASDVVSPTFSTLMAPVEAIFPLFEAART